MRNPLKAFFYFSRGERRGILVLIAGIVLVFLFGYMYSFWQEQHLFTEADQSGQAAALKEYEEFAASIQEKERQAREHFPRFQKEPSLPVILAFFNPNAADSVTFRQLGLPAWMTHNILRYRSKGGKFRKAEDFKKVYGLTAEQYTVLLPYIYIAHDDTVRTRLYTPVKKDSTLIPFKYPVGTVVDLNLADTTELKKIPGIGSGIARLIVNYRQRLGGFYRIEQLSEIKLDYRQLTPWLRVDGKEIRCLPLNKIGIERLRNHPYINFYQAKAFVEYRKKHGSIRSLKPFALLEEFSEADLEQIGRYVCFD